MHKQSWVAMVTAQACVMNGPLLGIRVSPGTAWLLGVMGLSKVWSLPPACLHLPSLKSSRTRG